MSRSEESTLSLFIVNVPYDVTEDEMRQCLSNTFDPTLGHVGEVRFFERNGRRTGSVRAFVSSQEAFDALLNLERAIDCGGRLLTIRPYRDNLASGRTTTISVSNIHFDATDQDLDDLFMIPEQPFRLYNGHFTGEVLLNFRNYPSAKKFMETFDNYTFMGRQLRVDYKVKHHSRRSDDGYRPKRSRRVYEQERQTHEYPVDEPRPRSPDGPPPNMSSTESHVDVSIPVSSEDA